MPVAPLLNPIGVYKGLAIGGFAGANEEILGLSVQPLKVPSPPNFLVSGLLTSNLLGVTKELSVRYATSPWAYFHLRKLRFACFVQDAESLLNLANSCTITFTGESSCDRIRFGQHSHSQFLAAFDENENRIDTQSFVYRNTGSLLNPAPFSYASFKDGPGCYAARVVVTVTTDTPLLDALGLNAAAFDDIEYTLKSAGCTPKSTGT